MVFQQDKVSGRSWLKAIHGGRIESVEQVEFDRVIRFAITCRTGLGHVRTYNLYFEFFKNGNIILTDDRRQIISALGKPARRGEQYRLTKSAGLDLRTLRSDASLTDEQMAEIIDLKIIQHSKAVGGGPAAVAKFLIGIENAPAPNLISADDDKAIGFAIYGGPFLDRYKGQPRDSLLVAITDYVSSVKQAEAGPGRDWQKRIVRAEKKLAAITEQIEQAESYPMIRRYGEIILSNLHFIKKGQAEANLPDPYSEANQAVPIQLEPALTPHKNAAAYFEKARKFEASLPRLKERLRAQQQHLAKLKEEAQGPPRLDKGFVSANRLASTTKSKLPFREFQLDNDWAVFVGKSATSNDELTFAFAQKDDYWFHAWQAAGSHVVLRAPNKKAIPDKKILNQAAALAAYYSKAKTSAKVPVIYTRVKYVRKIRGAAGKVTCTNEKELMVKPLKPELVIGTR